MNRLLMIGLVAVLSCTAWAGGNPDVRIYIDFDPPNYVHEYTPQPYETLNAYVCLDQLDDGATAIAFRMNDVLEECPGVFAPPGWSTTWPT